MTSSAVASRDHAERSLWQAGAVAVFLSAAGSAIVYFLAYITGIIPWNMLSPGRGVSLNPRLVISVSIGGALAGTLIYALLERITDDAPRVFRWIALVILVISFGAPLMMERFTVLLTLALDLMHVVVAVATVWALTVWRRQVS